MKEAEFWASMEKTTSGCWLWTRAKISGGYGMVSFRGSTTQAHRLAWVLTNGPIPSGRGYHGTIVAHKCDVRACCNPDHLFLTDQRGNLEDAALKDRLHFAKLRVSQVKEIIRKLQLGASATELTAEYGVSKTTISGIIKRRSWKPLTQNAGELRYAPREFDGKKWRKADYDKISSMLSSGKTLRQIAKECGTTHTTVRRVIEQEKLGHSSPFKRMTEVDRERIHDLSRAGHSQQEIANWLGVSRPSVSRTLTSSRAA